MSESPLVRRVLTALFWLLVLGIVQLSINILSVVGMFLGLVYLALS